MIAASRESIAASVTWPPSPSTATQPSFAGTSAATPMPVPGPSTPTVARGAGEPSPICTRSSGFKESTANAFALKSFMAMSRVQPNCFFSPSSEKCQALLIMAISSPITGAAMANAASVGRSPPTVAR